METPTAPAWGGGGEVPAPVTTERDKKPLSYASLASFDDCGLKFKMRQEKVPGEPGGPFLAGISIHAAIEESERQGWWRDAETAREDGPLLERFHALFDEKVEEARWRCLRCKASGSVTAPGLAVAGAETPPARVIDCPGCGGTGELQGPDAIRWAGRGHGEDKAWWDKQGEFMLRRYVETRQRLDAEGAEFPSEFTEVWVTAELPNGRGVRAKLDAFGALIEGDPVIVDWKSGRVGGSGPMQPTQYAWMIDHSPLSAVFGGVPVEKGLLVYLRAQEDHKREQWLDLTPLKPMVPGWLMNRARLAELGVYEPNEGAWHDSCSWRHDCSYYEALQAAKGAGDGGSTP